MRAQPAIPYRDAVPGKVYSTRLPDQRHPVAPEQDTLSKAFLRRVAELGDTTAQRKKRYGIWQEYNWNEVYDHVAHFALGLLQLGLEASTTLVIIGENDPEMYWAQIAAHALHCQTCCVFSDASSSDIAYVINATDATFVCAQDQEQIDKMLAIQADIPQVRQVIYWEERGLWGYDDDWLLSFDAVEKLGAQQRARQPSHFEDMARSTQPMDTVIFSMTSGTTSLPKFAEITHFQLVQGQAMNAAYLDSRQSDNWLSFSPMAWLAEQAFGFTAHLINGVQVNFPEGPETVPTDMREIAPAGLLFPSRVWENLARVVQFRINDGNWLNRALFALFMPIAYRVIDHEDAQQPVPPPLRFLRWLGEYAIFEPLRDKLGLVRARNVLTAGAMLSSDIIRFFRAIGIELRQYYGSTETFGTLHLRGDVRFETVGVIVPGVEVKIAENQEILIRTEARFKGYYKQPDQTGAALDSDGWYHTGDAGHMDEKSGHLIYLERVKDLIELANGERFSPQYIEGRVKFSQYVQDMLTIGGADRDFVSAIIVIDFQNVSRWAEKRGIAFTTYVDLSQRAEVYAIIRQELRAVNESLPAYSRVKRFVILHKEFDADEAELTRTRKLRRGALQEKYQQLLEAIYGGQRQVRISAEVRYRDGRRGTIETELQVADV
ncbi:MAG: long-chain fatty acid--CoA ligase [Chloroflexi bacterium]|nr:long-chain fatty acid--CoA ligase [Chloroflexota bacterium]MYE79603.1 long-chain fatty acid--CoA ligase [Chloroflexota bacterium]